ncbi:MAG: NUDIX domain-containing protein [Caldilineaceae bacterium]|nr:NUDIX domain-containing protein [Caldilineaceae bacterium]
MRFTCPIAVHIFLLQEQKVLLLRRYNTGYEDGNYSVPAGHLDGNEPVTQAAMREAREEVGVAIAPAALRVVGIMHRLSDREGVDFFVATDEWRGQPTNCEPHKCDELRWAAFDALPPNTIPYVRQALLNFQNGIFFAEFGWST